MEFRTSVPSSEPGSLDAGKSTSTASLPTAPGAIVGTTPRLRICGNFDLPLGLAGSKQMKAKHRATIVGIECDARPKRDGVWIAQQQREGSAAFGLRSVSEFDDDCVI